MWELLVRKVDKRHLTDPVNDRQLLKRGDVVAIKPGGHPWSKRERTNPEWEIIRVSGASLEALEHLLLGDPPDLCLPAEEARRRVVSLVFEDLKPEMTLTQIRSAEVVRPKRHRGVVEL